MITTTARNQGSQPNGVVPWSSATSEAMAVARYGPTIGIISSTPVRIEMITDATGNYYKPREIEVEPGDVLRSPNGTLRVIDGCERSYTDGYWIKTYPVPQDSLQGKRRLIEAAGPMKTMERLRDLVSGVLGGGA